MFIWAPYAQLYSLAETPHHPPFPAIGLIYEGSIGQPKKTTSLCDPLALAKRPLSLLMRQRQEAYCNNLLLLNINNNKNTA
jgi:hypothetical protein